MTRKTIAALVVAVITSACSGKDSPLAPTPPPVPDCEKNHTAVLTITNNAANLLPRTVSIDGATYGLLAWSETQNYTLAASVPHNVKFYSPVNGALISGAEGLILNQCSTFALTNTFDVGGKIVW